MNKLLHYRRFVLFAVASSLFGFAACSDGFDEINVVGGLDTKKRVEIVDGKMVDPRDGKEYSVAEINGVFWMTENLRYADSSNMKNLKGNSWCHEDDKDCSKFGRLYSWTAAVNQDSKYISTVVGTTSSFQGICPDGWVLPSSNDWKYLVNYVDQNNGGEGSGTSLKSTETWNKTDEVKAPTNRFGFNAKASGRRNNDGETFLSTGRVAAFWSLYEKDATTAYGWQLRDEVDALQEGFFYKDHGLSVRCIANSLNVSVKGDLDSSYLDKIPHDYGSWKYEGETYRTIKIAGLEWMADNLNYEVKGSHCFKDDKEYCKEYGRLYTYEAAKTVCPKGWHLPTVSDFTSLITYAKSSSALRSTTGWNDKASKGLNFWGFDAKPAGGRDSGDYFDLKSSAYFWMDGVILNGNASALVIRYNETIPNTMSYGTSNEFSVRCVRD